MQSSTALVKHTDGTLHDLLDLCFTMFSFQEENKQYLTSQFLCKQSIPRSLCTLNQKTIDEKVKTAVWLSIQAVTLQSMPCGDLQYYSSPFQEEENFKRLFKCFYQYSLSPDMDIDKVLKMFQKYPREKVLIIADDMFQMAKKIVMEPGIYEQLPCNFLLVQSAFNMANYLIMSVDGIDDAKLLLSSIKVYFERIGDCKEDFDLSHLSEYEYSQYMQYKQAVEKLAHMNTMTELTLWYNYTPRTRKFYSEKKLKKFLKRIISAFKTNKCMELEMKYVIEQYKEGIAQLVSILDNKLLNAQSIEHFVLICRTLRREQRLFPFWCIWVFMIETYAIEIALNRKSLKDETAYLRNMKIHLADEISRELVNSLPLVAVTAPRFAQVVVFAANTHLEQSEQLCSKKDLQYDAELGECYNLLLADAAVCEVIVHKFGDKIFESMSARLLQRLKLRVQTHKEIMNKALQNYTPYSTASVESIITSSLDAFDRELQDMFRMQYQ
jgi:hypothetical protein